MDEKKDTPPLYSDLSTKFQSKEITYFYALNIFSCLKNGKYSYKERLNYAKPICKFLGISWKLYLPTNRKSQLTYISSKMVLKLKNFYKLVKFHQFFESLDKFITYFSLQKFEGTALYQEFVSLNLLDDKCVDKFTEKIMDLFKERIDLENKVSETKIKMDEEYKQMVYETHSTMIDNIKNFSAPKTLSDAIKTSRQATEDIITLTETYSRVTEF